MKTIKTEINLYGYEELKGKAKEKAFEEHSNFILDNPSDYENEKGKMVYDDYSKWKEKDFKEMVEESILINEYMFFENGEMADIIHFTGEHEKSGTTEFYFQGKTYKI